MTRPSSFLSFFVAILIFLFVKVSHGGTWEFVFVFVFCLVYVVCCSLLPVFFSFFHFCVCVAFFKNILVYNKIINIIIRYYSYVVF